MLPASAASDALCNVASAASDMNSAHDIDSDMNSAHDIDWGACMICQKSIKDERTYCPLNGPQDGVREASVVYEAFAGRFQEMRRSGSILVKQHFKLDNLFEQDTLPNIAHEMFLKQGIWHKPCYNQFNSTAVSRMLQRKRVLVPAGTLPDSASLTNLEPTDMMGLVGPTALNDDGSRRKSFRGASGMFDDNKCIFCQQQSSDALHNVSTSDCGANFYEQANVLQLQPLLTILAYADKGKKGVENNMKYHQTCRISTYNLYKTSLRSNTPELLASNSSITDLLAARAFCNLTRYIEQKVEGGDYYPTFPDLLGAHTRYREVAGLEGGISEHLLKQKLTEHFEGQANWVKRDNKTLSLCFQRGLRHDAVTLDDSFKNIAATAKIIRNSIFNHEAKYEFANQQFTAGSQESSVPELLKALVCFILYPGGEDIIDTQHTLTIAQLLMSLSKKTTPSCSVKNSRMQKNRETPLLMYTSMFLHHEVKSMKCVEMLYQLGLGVHPCRLSAAQDDIAFTLCETFRKEDQVVPPCLRRNEPLSFHIDNADVQTVSTHVGGEFHGTAISVFQPNCHTDKKINKKQPAHFPAALHRNLELPSKYVDVPISMLNIKNVTLPQRQRLPITHILDPTRIQSALEKLTLWVSNVEEHIMNGKVVDKDSTATFAAFHAAISMQSNRHLSDLPATRALLPVLDESFCNISNITHALKVAMDITQKVHPGQKTIVCFDNPAFIIGRSVQMVDPAFGRDVLFLELGGLHLEMNLQDMSGNLLENSGWTEILKLCGIASPLSCLGHSNAMKTRHSITISVCALSVLQKISYMNTQPVGAPFVAVHFESWRILQLTLPNFQFWDLVLRFHKLILVFVSAIRDRDLLLYIDTLEKILPFMFALDKPNYARWASVNLHDLKTQTPEFRRQYSDIFALFVTLRPFSGMPTDQNGENLIKRWKSVGGQSDLTQKPAARLKNEIISGEIELLLKAGMLPGTISDSNDSAAEESDEEELNSDTVPARNHHSHGTASQKLLIKQVRLFVHALTEIGNPFSDISLDLVVLETRQVMHPDVSKSYRSMEELGTTQFLKFTQERLVECTESINKPLKRNNAYTYSNLPKAVVAKEDMTIAHLKHDSHTLFRALTAITTSDRDVSIESILQHENQPFPPSLSDNQGNGRKTEKSKILDVLLKIPGDAVPLLIPTFVTSYVLDGPAIVHMLKGSTLKVKTFDEFFSLCFNPYIVNLLGNCEMVSVVFDIYLKAISLKYAERCRRGSGGKTYNIIGQTPFVSDFQAFLRNDINKENLFIFLAACIQRFTYPSGKVVYVTSGQHTLTSAMNVVDRPALGGAFLGVSDHEEADTRMFLHAAHAFSITFLRGSPVTVVFRTVDSDVVVAALSIFAGLLGINPDGNLWIMLGTGENKISYHINAIFTNLGPDKALALAYFSTLTGCDTVSSFFNKGKIGCYKAWASLPHSITTGLIECLTQEEFIPLTVESNAFKCVETLTVCIYDKNLQSCQSVNEARATMASQRTLDFEKIPPTQAALLQHANRALYQAHIWVHSLNRIQNLPSPSGFGWIMSNGKWDILWTKESVTCKDMAVLVKCNCKTVGGCGGGNCKCHKYNLPCTDMCTCLCE